VNLLKKTGMGIAFLLLSLSLSAYGPNTIKRLTSAVKSLASPALRAMLEVYPESLDGGIQSALKEFSGAPAEAVKAAVAAEVGSVARLPKEKAPLDSIVFHFGRVAGLAWVANDPLLFGGDARSREIRPDFENYVERKLNRMMLAFDGYDRPPLDDSVESYIAWRIAGGARYRKALFFCYFKGGRRMSSKTFDDRSNAFGVAQVVLSHGISDAAKLWFAMWRSMDGDVSGTPYYRPVKSPKAEQKNATAVPREGIS